MKFLAVLVLVAVSACSTGRLDASEGEQWASVRALGVSNVAATTGFDLAASGALSGLLIGSTR